MHGMKNLEFIDVHASVGTFYLRGINY